ncbi:MAG: N-acetylglucosamine-6-phosphate deacetylase [Ktedonobacteraceae bacterium]|nr:N-acetylglucosamine-6-phosphate deacetylase [Ktedonobacteraceae bacterium]
MHSVTGDGTAQPLHIVVASKLYAPEEIAGPVAVVLEGATIRSVWRGEDAISAQKRIRDQVPDAAVEVSDLGPLSLAPGYIDLHIHGFGGHDVTTGSQEDIESIAHQLPQTGVTSFFPTIATLGKAETMVQVQTLANAAEKQRDAQAAEILGIRLEGPFICRAKKGAQYEPGIRPPDPQEMEELAEAGRGWVRIIDYAPEEDLHNLFLATAVRLGILPCVGHTSATYEQAIRAIDGGALHSTHLFNAMSPLAHREPGVAGAFLTDSRATVEIIADGIHIHPAIAKLVVASRGTNRVALITDAVAPTGQPEGEYDFVGRTVTLCCGAVRLEDGSLAGSVLTLESAVRNILAFTGCSWSDAIAMATQVPATISHLAQRKGQITPGADADFVALNDQGFVQQTWVRGTCIYKASSESTIS